MQFIYSLFEINIDGTLPTHGIVHTGKSQLVIPWLDIAENWLWKSQGRPTKQFNLNLLLFAARQFPHLPMIYIYHNQFSIGMVISWFSFME